MSTHLTPTDELLLLAETLGEVKARTDKLESEFLTQAKPLEAAATALQAALAGIKSLQFHVLDNNLGQLSARVEEMRTSISEQVEVIATELKRADAENAQKSGADADALRNEIAQLQAQLGTVKTQFAQQLERVELEAAKKVQEFAAIPGPVGPAGKSPRGRGPFQPGVKYEAGDIVSFLGGSYLSNDNGNDEKPGAKAKRWTQLVSRAAGGAPPLESMGGTLQISQGGTGQTSAAAGARALLAGIGSTQGQVLYHNGTQWSALTAGASGTFLKSQGAGANPAWAAVTDSSAATDAEAVAAASTTTFTTPANAALAAMRVANTKSPRPGVAFDGTSGAKVTTTASAVMAINTDPRSVVWTMRVPTSAPGGDSALWTVADAVSYTGNAFRCVLASTGKFQLRIFGTTTSDYRQALTSSSIVSTFGGKVVVFALVAQTSGLTLYANGTVVSLDSDTTSGSAPATWQGAIAVASGLINIEGGTPYELYTADVYNLALSAADVLEITESGGAVPYRFQYGSQAIVTGRAVYSGGDVQVGATATQFTVVKASGASYAVSSWVGASRTPSTIPPGSQWLVAGTLTLNNGKTQKPVVYFDGVSSPFTSITVASGAAFAVVVTAPPGITTSGLVFSATGDQDYTISDLEVYQIGAVVHLALDEGIGYQLHDASTNKLDAVMTTTGVHHLVPKREGYVRQTHQWTGANDPKYLGAAQQIFPVGVLMTDVVLFSTASTTGSGANLSSALTVERWMGNTPLTANVRKIGTLLNRLPIGTAALDHSAYIVPDSVAFTGSITTEMLYKVTEGTP